MTFRRSRVTLKPCPTHVPGGGLIVLPRGHRANVFWYNLRWANSASAKFDWPSFGR